jgi:galactokinase/mevalonate kinase-like predicted kinase
MLDEKKRPEVGVDDIDIYEFGGLEIDNKLTNGYQLYIPYGIHCEIFDTLQDSIRLLYNQREECEKDIRNVKDMELTDKNKNAIKYIIDINTETIRRINRDLKILEKIVPLKDEI